MAQETVPPLQHLLKHRVPTACTLGGAEMLHGAHLVTLAAVAAGQSHTPSTAPFQGLLAVGSTASHLPQSTSIVWAPDSSKHAPHRMRGGTRQTLGNAFVPDVAGDVSAYSSESETVATAAIGIICISHRASLIARLLHEQHHASHHCFCNLTALWCAPRRLHQLVCLREAAVTPSLAHPRPSAHIFTHSRPLFLTHSL